MNLTVIPPTAPALPPIDVDFLPRRSFVDSVTQSATQIAAGVVAAVRNDKQTIKRLEAQLAEALRRNAELAQEIASLHAAKRYRWTAAQREALAELVATEREQKLTYAKMAVILTERFGRPFNARQVGDAARRLKRAG